MKLQGLDGQAIELEILGVRYPKDKDWLSIKVRVIHPLGSWSAIDPALQAYEIEELAQWFENIVVGKETKNYLRFLENSLQFHYLGEAKDRVLRVYFEHEARPNWATSFEENLDDLWIDIPLSEVDLFAASQALRDMLRGLPPRSRH